MPLTHVGVVIFRQYIAYEVTLLGNVVWRDARRCWKWLSRFGVAESCRPSIAPPVRGGAAVVCANIHCDVLLLIVVVWWDARSCRTMSTRRGARHHRFRRPCAVASPSCAPRLLSMYQYSLLLFGVTSAHVGQCRPVEARDAVSTIDVAACARRHRRRVHQGYLRCTSTRCCHSTRRMQMADNVVAFWRAKQCRPAISPPVCASAVERLKCTIAHMVASNETI
jgi:hypothetical protein